MTATKITLWGAAVVATIGAVFFIHSRSKTAQGTAKDASADAAAKASTSAGKTTTADAVGPSGQPSQKLKNQLNDATAVLNFGLNAINAARAAAQTPGK